MKRIKLNRGEAVLPTFYRADGKDQGNRASEENSNETVGFRMLENLKMALLFSWTQNQTEKERQGG
ncbi:hypothetical protein GCM10011386_28040 [Parapedobacter defluvii]|uniref:Uncharacterized protein n=1 Tax=Parapedobacter defluvii TaxID=2045106 RepID=A0ABQ1M3W7_9SPHI|nr:hypothetical protein [Parapedobacter defluvii]RQP11239.1 MAG: hypothetical protein EAS52_21845 [Parapedobacter sp.]GGC34348.1 hypothetical protein GCM10011386_28040 [Parapedobacter defluvii]